MIAYEEFIARKAVRSDARGFEVESLPEWLFPFQQAIVARAIARGRFAVFADTGLGKTRMELAIAQEVAAIGHRSLILCPLAVAGQTIAEGRVVGVEVGSPSSGALVHILNYDRLSEVDPADYGCVILDESSILKSFDGKTRNALCETFALTPYRFAFTATPSPNDHIELGNHAEFLGAMTMQGMLARFFVHDSKNTSEWRLKGHGEAEFWAWVASWAVAGRKPSDFGPFEEEDARFELPDLRLIPHIVGELDDSVLFSSSALSATEAMRVKRTTADVRADAVAETIAADPNEAWAVWGDTDAETEAVMARVPSAIEVRGPMKPDVKEDRLLGFGEGRYDRLVTKASIAGFGMNWQRCARTAFVGVTHSYERFYQAVRRFWRFGQTRAVEAHVFLTDAEWSLWESIQRKADAHEAMVASMVSAMRKGAVDAPLIAAERDDAFGDGWHAMRGDCVERIKEVESGSVGYSIFSPPFASLYTYTDSPNDMGNCADDQEFFDHFRYLVPEIFRVLMPGRLVSMHCMDLPMTKGRDGEIGLRDFPGELIRLFESEGFVFHSRVTIWKDPLVAMQRTKAIGLLHKQLCKDSAMSRQGIADYLITMRKPGTNPEPIAHGAGLGRWIGDPSHEPTALPTENAATNKYGHEVWQRYASPVWMDINPGRVLPYAGARDTKDERHICPLQLDVIERGVELWSNPGDLVFTPFAGVGSEMVVPIKAGRKAKGIELKGSYFDQLVLNCGRAERDASAVQLDLWDEEAA